MRISAVTAAVLLCAGGASAYAQNAAKNGGADFTTAKSMVLIRGGSFVMGSPEGENWREKDETQHTVVLDDFWISKYEVTQAEYEAVMKKNPSSFRGKNLPVDFAYHSEPCVLQSLFKGKYSATRIILTAVNAALAVSSVLLAISGIMLSNRVFLFLGIERGMGFARKAHLAASHWYFVLIAFHFALHTAILFGRITVRGGRLIAMRCVVCAASLYGVVAFVRLSLWKYLFLTQEFFFFDMQRGFALFLLDYICMFVLFASVIKIASFFVKNAKSSESERLQKS